MKYTEEEFFGNNQNTEQRNTQQELYNKSDVGFTVLTTFLKTTGLLICLSFYVIAVLFTLTPSTTISLFEFFRADKAIVACYERIYQKSGNLADLYNLVQKSIQAKEHNKTTKYIKEMQSKGDYESFCIEVNLAVEKVTENKLIAFVGDLDSYLVSQNIIALYNSGKKDQSLQIALTDLKNNNIYSIGLAGYIQCVLKDNSMSLETRKQKILAVYNMVYEEELVSDLLEERRDNADISLADSDDTTDKILRVYTCLKIENIKLKIYEIQHDNNAVSDSHAELEELQNIYDELIK